MTTFQDEQRERRETLQNDVRLREQQQGTTLSQFAQAEADIDRGRFGNMIGEGKIKTNVAEVLLIGAAKSNGVWKDDPDNCLQTIRDGLRDGRDQWVQLGGKRADSPQSKKRAS